MEQQSIDISSCYRYLIAVIVITLTNTVSVIGSRSKNKAERVGRATIGARDFECKLLLNNCMLFDNHKNNARAPEQNQRLTEKRRIGFEFAHRSRVSVCACVCVYVRIFAVVLR